MQNNSQKIFLIINSYLLGDMLLVNSLVQNIKRIYKNSKVVMLSSNTLKDISQNQEGADEVIIWDRHNEHKGFFGMLKFKKEFPYKNIYAAFPIYGTDRPILLSHLLGAKFVLFRNKKNIFKYLLKKQYNFDYINSDDYPMQYWHLNLLKGITKEELIDCKIKYNIKKDTINPIDEKEYIVLCPVSSRKTKDMPYETVVDLIKKIDKKVVILGNGEVSRNLSEKLKKENLENLIDLTDKTTLDEAAKVIKNSKGVISIDTGLLHLSCAVDKEVVAVFYEVESSPFMPDCKMYKSKVIAKNQNADNILKELKILIGE